MTVAAGDLGELFAAPELRHPVAVAAASRAANVWPVASWMASLPVRVKKDRQAHFI
jgi:hypothetical protein